MDFIFLPGQDVGLAMIDTFSKFATVIAISDKKNNQMLILQF